jgi:hypothetical protein
VPKDLQQEATECLDWKTEAGALIVSVKEEFDPVRASDILRKPILTVDCKEFVVHPSLEHRKSCNGKS